MDGLKDLKRARSAAKGLITRVQNEIKELLLNVDDLKSVRAKIPDLDSAMDKFRSAHETYHANLTDEFDIEESQEYFEAEVTRVCDLKHRIDAITTASALSRRSRNPKSIDEYSSVTSRRSSHVSTRSALAAKRASLKAQAALLKKRQALQEEEFKLKQKMEQLDLETELAKTIAIEEVYEGESNYETVSGESSDDESSSSSESERGSNSSTKSDVMNESVNQKKPVEKTQPSNATRHPTDDELKQHNLSTDQNIPTNRLSTDAMLSATDSMPSDLSMLSDSMQPLPTDSTLPTMQPIDSKPPIDSAPPIKTEPTIKPEPTVDENVSPSVSDVKPNVTPTNDNALLNVITAQRMQTQHIETLLMQQQRHTLALMLPQPQVTTFGGDPLEYRNFIRAFENIIELKTDSDSDSARLYYLVQYTKGDVQELMQSCLSMGPTEGYREARKLLKQRYGQDYKIASSYINRLTEEQPIKTESGKTLHKFSTLLTSCRNTLREIGYSTKIENSDTLRQIVDKLPYSMRVKWRDIADTITERKGREITVDDLASFVEDRARIAGHPIFGNLTTDNISSAARHKKKEERNARSAATFTTQTHGRTDNNSSNSNKNRDGQHNSATNRKQLECPSCRNSHWLSQCSDFRGKSLEERHKLVRSKGLCDNCLTSGHVASSCPKPSFCKVEGCLQKHSTFLHPKQENSKEPSVNNGGDNVTSTIKQYNVSARNGFINGLANESKKIDRNVTALPIVPVVVKAEGSVQSICTYAFLDGGSNSTFCTERLTSALGIKGKKSVLSLTTLEKTDSPTQTSITSLEVTDLNGDHPIQLQTVYSIERLPVSTESLPSVSDVRKWPHFEDLDLESINADVDLLIGSDVPQALQPLEVRGGRDGEPFAMRTALGWAVVGPLGSEPGSFHTANLVQSADLESQFKQFCNMEFKDALYDEKKTMSQEDKRALKVMKETAVLKDGHYEMSLPWKRDPPDLENNRCVALHRLSLLKKRLARDPKLHQMYREFIDKLLKSDHAKRVADDAPRGKVVWYLPHHPVFHPKKPDKVRVVYDCSAKFKGKSLNDELLQGPDLTNSLFGVITRFREEPVALMSDIEAMFYQVRVTGEDRDALRFLWFKDGNLDGDIDEFQMNVHLFGGASSPSCANFALRKTAEDNCGEFSEQAIETVKRNFYVDDCLKSVATERAATKLARELRELLAKGGFRLTKWMSNSPAVLSSIPEDERAPSIKSLDFDTTCIERALGIQWNVSSDKFGFTIAIKERPVTRRGILSVVSSIYDPLGFVAPFTLPAKMLLQDLCRQKLGWDDPLPETDLQRWKTWLQDLPKLENLNISRCFKPEGFGDVKSSQLHHFSDASQQGYGAVTYLRLVNQDGRVHCAFVCGKSRLAPLKPITVPRMELSAAVLSTKLDRMAKQELSSLPQKDSLFWTDSTCVLGYVQNEKKRFHTFVANRIAAIHDATSSPQWKYVNTELNPADEASRGLSITESFDDLRWIQGPPFLWQPESNWPELPSDKIKIEDNDPELKGEATACAIQAKVKDDALTKIFERFSSWQRLKKFVAWMMRFKGNLRKAQDNRKLHVPTAAKGKPEPLTVDELNVAEREIIKHVQKSVFLDEINMMSSKSPKVLRSSSISDLSPRLIDQMLCVGGRLSNAPITDENKHPIILPSKHHVTELLVRHHHITSGHCGTEYVLSQVRQRYWIVKGRSAVRRTIGSCFLCRKHHGKVQQQKMADLPRDRVTPANPPFTSVGIDFFGPFSVKRGRATVKRYGVIFTCLTVRAVHIEVAHSLNTDSFINTLRRFIARRGPPQEIRTDNGTNFVGGERELREAVQSMNQEAIHRALLARNIKWTFNPPSGSHHGGVWERCIRSARKILHGLLKEQTVCDETLSTLLCEVEMIMNNRPLTKVSDDQRDMEALTPNHLLLLRPGQSTPPGLFVKEDCYSRKRWRQVQYLADMFWKRWVKEYLPTLQSRQKWHLQQRNLQPNDVVLVVDDTAHRSSWPLGRVLEVYKNSGDELVRSAKIQTKTSTLLRPISKLVVLEESNGDV